MAVDMWNELTVTRATDGQMRIDIEGEGAGLIPTDETNLVAIGAKAAFEAAGQEYVPLHFKCKNRIPFGRGLGSSSAAIVSGIMAGKSKEGVPGAAAVHPSHPFHPFHPFHLSHTSPFRAFFVLRFIFFALSLFRVGVGRPRIESVRGRQLVQGRG